MKVTQDQKLLILALATFGVMVVICGLFVAFCVVVDKLRHYQF